MKTEITAGQTVTVLKWKKREDYSYIGDQMKVLAVDFPFVKVMHPMACLGKITLDTRQVEIKVFTDDFANA
ncbi:MAG: hypothetical protein ACR2PH_12810 [Desulfobulbia bacterium]